MLCSVFTAAFCCCVTPRWLGWKSHLNRHLMLIPWHVLSFEWADPCGAWWALSRYRAQLFRKCSVKLGGFLKSFCGMKTHNSGCSWWEWVPGVRETVGLTVAVDSELAALFHRPSPGALNNQHLHYITFIYIYSVHKTAENQKIW